MSTAIYNQLFLTQNSISPLSLLLEDDTLEALRLTLGNRTRTCRNGQGHSHENGNDSRVDIPETIIDRSYKENKQPKTEMLCWKARKARSEFTMPAQSKELIGELIGRHEQRNMSKHLDMGPCWTTPSQFPGFQRHSIIGSLEGK